MATEEKPKPKLNITFNIIPKTLEKSFKDLFPGFKDGLVRGEPGGYIMPATYAHGAQEVYEMEPREDDVFVIGFLKSGTTWASEMVWLLKNNLDYKEAAETILTDRVPYPELVHWMAKEMKAEIEKIGDAQKLRSPKDLAKMPSPRVFRPHATLELLHPDLLNVAKVVYIARNPKDVMVSYFHYHKMMIYQHFTGDFDQFVHLFMADELMATPFFHHVLTAWEKRNHPNMHFVFYEQFKMDLEGEVIKLATFLGKTLTKKELDQLLNHLSFGSFEKNGAVNMEIFKEIDYMNKNAGNFIRKGIIGDWKNYFSPELNEKVDQWIAKNLAGSDLKFVTD